MAISKTLRYQILRRDSYTCRYCGSSAPEVKLHVDHVVPEVLGGRADAANLQTLCADCNGGKSATPPDAAQVEQVSADALRWAQAQQIVVAQMLADHGAKEALYEQVDEEWNRGRGGGMPRPQDWRRSVGQLLAAGLPIELIVDAVTVAMENRQIYPENLWRYACGVAWKRVEKIREETAAQVGGTTAVGPARPANTSTDRDAWEMKGWAEGHKELADSILDYFSGEERVELLRRGKQQAIEDGDELDHEPSDSPYLLGRATMVAFEDCFDEAHSSRHLIRALLDGLPEDLHTRVMTEALDDMRLHHGDDFDEHGLRRWALQILSIAIDERFGAFGPFAAEAA